MLYATLFIGVLYFKMFRVRRQQEKLSFGYLLKAFMTIGATVALIIYAFMTQSWYVVLSSIIISVIMASLMITTVQLGIFIDGKPLFKLSSTYKVMPVLSLLTIIGTIMTITPFF